jgi:lactoylglutathione lyase
MRIQHIAIWTRNLEEMLKFYATYFRCSYSEKYVNTKNGFEAHFLFFDDSASIELMRKSTVRKPGVATDEEHVGFAHVAISVGSKEMVSELTDTLHKDGYTIVSEPRTTGDGFFESVVLDPDGNRIELTV